MLACKLAVWHTFGTLGAGFRFGCRVFRITRVGMQPSTQNRHEADQLLAREALRSNSGWRRLVDRYGPAIWQLCASACPEKEREASFAEFWQALAAEQGALLRRYDGRASLVAYFQFLAVDLLSKRIQALLRSEPSRGWLLLEGFFSREIRRQIATVAGSPRQLAAMGVMMEDVYQDLALELGEDGFRRLRAYDGRGSFAGFVRRVLRNLCLDWKRKQMGRRRLPTAIARLGELEQRVYEWMSWGGCSAEEVQSRLTGSEPKDEILEAIRKVEQAVAKHQLLPQRVAAGSGFDLERLSAAGSAPSPERMLLDGEKEEKRESLLRLVQEVVERLPAQQRLYVRLRFFEEPPLTPRQIATVLRAKETDVYRIRQDVASALRAELVRAGVDRESFLLLEG
jgi:RNA polymerase primary sigma factor